MFSHFDGYNFVRLVCPFAVGILAFVYWEIQLPILGLFLPIVFLVIIAFNSIRSIKSQFKFVLFYGILLNAWLIAFGNYLAVKADASAHPQYFAKHINTTPFLTVQIEKPFVKKAKYFKSIGSIKNILADESSTHQNQKIYLNIKDIDSADLPQYGDILVIKNKLFEIDAPKNPGAFNYQRFSNVKQIYFQTYVSKNDYQVICEACGSEILTTIFKLRKTLMQSLETHINDRAVLAIASALLLGQKDYLTPDIQEMYAGTGAMHILAVSGLHVGILLMILSFIFKPLENIQRGKALKALLIIICIWLYAGITGFAPSVTRAALMFSLYLIGDLLNRDKNIYNILAASAFLILLFKPNMIAEVGFQLSYAAVFSIVWLYPYIYKTFFFSNRVLDFFWSISAVSLAAQIGTFPISMYYFHQFPVTFFVANLMAIPSATVIFVGGVGLFFFDFISNSIAAFIGLFLESVIQTLNFVLHQLEQLPFSTIQFNAVSFYIPFLLALVFVGLIKWLITEKRLGLITAGFCLLFLCSSYAWNKFKIYTQKKLVFYHNYKSPAVEWIEGKSYTRLSNQNENKDKLNRFIFKPAHNYFGTSSPNQDKLSHYNQQLLLLDDQSIFIIDSTYKRIENLPFKIDVLLLTGNPYIDLKQLNNAVDFKQIVFAADNSNYYINRWQKHCDELSLPCYNIKEEGAFVWDIP